MQEIGVVTSVKGEKATVKLDKKDECSKCGMCLFPQNASSIEIEADNQIGAKVGDTVTFERQADGKLLGALLVFLVPLLLIGISAILSYLVIGKEIYMLVMSLSSIIVWFFILSMIDKKLKKTTSFCWVIVDINQKQKN